MRRTRDERGNGPRYNCYYNPLNYAISGYEIDHEECSMLNELHLAEVKGNVEVIGAFNDVMPSLGKHYVDIYTLVRLPPDDTQIPQVNSFDFM
jgi:hypothetical protein